MPDTLRRAVNLSAPEHLGTLASLKARFGVFFCGQMSSCNWPPIILVVSIMMASKTVSAETLTNRVDNLDWQQISRELDQQGNGLQKGLLTSRQCDALTALYPGEEYFRSRIVMERFSFGRGEYKYFKYPLPNLVSELREALYPHLEPVANRWNELMGIDVRYPKEHSEFIALCHKAGQRKPTPLLLQYGPGDFNCLHQDLYGEHFFPIQITILLSQPGRDF